MKALFVTTQTHDTWNHVDAWDSVASAPAKRIHFDYRNGVGTDAYVLRQAAKAGDVDVIFYIGANRGGGLPSYEAFRELRKIAPVVNIVSDAADRPWHAPIAMYRKEECFDLHVGIDGDPNSPVDLVTLTPVDARIFDSMHPDRDIRCGFSGTPTGKRGEVLGAIGSRCAIRMRGTDYLDHVRFMKRCRMILNIAFTGSGERYHVKGRVTETGHAGAVLLEPRPSPTSFWYPSSAYIRYKDAAHLIEIIETISDDEIARHAEEFARITREKYSAAKIYGAMLEKIGVDLPESFKAA